LLRIFLFLFLQAEKKLIENCMQNKNTTIKKNLCKQKKIFASKKFQLTESTKAKKKLT